jgi:hypothetical protein
MDAQWTQPTTTPEQLAEEPVWWRCTRSEFVAKYQDVRGSTAPAEVDAIGEFFTHMIATGAFSEMEPGSGSYEVLLLEDVTEMFEYFALEYAKRQPTLGIDDSLFNDGDFTGYAGYEIGGVDTIMAENYRYYSPLFENDGHAYFDSLAGNDYLLHEDTILRREDEDNDKEENYDGEKDEEDSPGGYSSNLLDDLVLDDASHR